MKTYTLEPRLDGKFIYIHVPELDYGTQATHAEDIERMGRDLIATVLDVEPEDFNVNILELKGEKVEEQEPAGPTRFVTASQLQADASAVIESLQSSDEPAIIVRHGKLLATISPLSGDDVLHEAFGRMAQDLPDAEEIAKENASVSTDSLSRLSLDPSLSRLGAREFEFRIRYGDRVMVTCDWEAYEEIKATFPESKGYVHEGRELTPWLPQEEAGAALIPLRSLMWKILEEHAADYERIAAGQKKLMDDEGNSIAVGAWSAYQRASEDLRRIISQWRDNYH